MTWVKNGVWSLITLLVVSFLNFALVRHAPVTPEDMFSGQQLSASLQTAQGALIQESPSLLSQYGDFMGGYLRGNFGWSQMHNAPVYEVMKEPFALSLVLAISAIMLSYALGYGLTGLYFIGGPRLKRALYLSVSFFQVVPKLLIALCLILFLASDVGIPLFPLYGLGGATVTGGPFDVGLFFWHLALPALTLVVSFSPKIFLYFTGLLSRSHGAWLFLQSRGLSQRQIFFRFQGPELLKTLTWRFANDMVFFLFTYGFVVEIVFGLPGMGNLGYQAIVAGDTPLFVGIFFLFALLNLSLNMGLKAVSQARGAPA